MLLCATHAHRRPSACVAMSAPHRARTGHSRGDGRTHGRLHRDAFRRRSGGEPQPDRHRRQPQRDLYHRTWSLPAARAAGGVHPLWACGGHVTDAWPLLYCEKHVLLICVFTEQTLFEMLKKATELSTVDNFRAKTKRFPRCQDLAGCTINCFDADHYSVTSHRSFQYKPSSLS